MTEAKIRVGILFGGQSAEHEISILSARNVLAALDLTRFEPLLIGIAKDGRWLVQDAQRLLASARDPRLVRIDDGPPAQLPSTFGAPPPSVARSIDVVFPVLHGTLGEDGAVQGLLEVAGIPYVGAGILGSAIGMDKDVMKRLLRDAGSKISSLGSSSWHSSGRGNGPRSADRSDFPDARPSGSSKLFAGHDTSPQASNRPAIGRM